MLTERERMLAGELYDPLDAELVAARQHARDLCHALDATRERDQVERRLILSALFGRGGDSVWMQPPFLRLRLDRRRRDHPARRPHRRPRGPRRGQCGDA